MIKSLKSENGGSSILVALVLIILVVFAALAISTSASNLRLAGKNSDTVKVFYSLDSEGERVLYDVKKSLNEGIERAEEVIAAIKESRYKELDIPDELMIEIQGASASKIQSNTEDWYSQLAIYYTRNMLEEKYPGYISGIMREGEITEVSINRGFILKQTIIIDYEKSHRYLNIQIRVSDVAFEKTIDDICVVEEWRLWQEPFEYKNEVDLWEGEP